MQTRIKNLFIFSLTGLCLFTGCRKERKYTCNQDYTYVSAQIAFSGFSALELGMVVIGRYTAGSDFGDLIAQDTLDATTAHFEGDTAYNSNNFGFFLAEGKVDFKVTVPATGKVFRITDIRTFEPGYRWEQDEACATGRTFVVTKVLGYKVDGMDYIPFERKTNNWYIYLAK